VGKEDPVEFDSNLTWRSNMRGVEHVGDLLLESPSFTSRETPLLPFTSRLPPLKKGNEKGEKKEGVSSPGPLADFPVINEIPLLSPLLCSFSEMGKKRNKKKQEKTKKNASLETMVSLGVWLGRHACYTATQAS